MRCNGTARKAEEDVARGTSLRALLPSVREDGDSFRRNPLTEAGEHEEKPDESEEKPEGGDDAV